MKRNMLRFSRLLTLGICGLGATAGCDNRPVQDDFRSNGGIAPDPAGVIEGSVLYIGPRPTCEYDGDRPVRVIGRVILTMFRFENPPPPEGTATSAENLLAISGDELFSTRDCLPKGVAPDPSDKLMRSVAFRWPQIVLEKGTVDYQLRGFYDYDADMNPFFRVKNMPTAGDIAGAALVNIQDRSKGLMRISMPSREDAHDGHVARGITVALGNYVWTERPVFKLSANTRQISAEEPIPVDIDFSLEVPEPDPINTLQAIWELSCTTPKQIGCEGLSLESLSEDEVGSTFEAAGVELDFSAERYAWTALPVDVKTIVDGGPDLNLPDGIPDPHPILGTSLRVPYMLPALILQRRALTAESVDIEAAAKIPGVLMLGAPLPGELETKQTFVGDMHMGVTPLAVVDLDPTNPSCRVPYVPPGNSTNSYEDRIAICHDLPTGVYSANVLHGVSGGTAEEADVTVSDNGFVIAGGGLAGQAWSIPNELADPEQVGEGNELAHQGTAQLFVVHDPRPGESGSCEKALPPEGELRPVVYRGVCEPGQELLVESAGNYGTLKGIDGVACLPEACCDAVAHLCDVPLCDVVELDGPNPGEKLKVHGSPTRIEKTLDGVGVPDCVPFEVPGICCEG